MLVKAKNTIGAMNRLRDRNLRFGYGEFAAGPAVSPIGADNADLALRYGTYRQEPPPRVVFRFKRYVLLRGRNVRDFCALSDWVMASVAWRSFAACKEVR